MHINIAAAKPRKFKVTLHIVILFLIFVTVTISLFHSIIIYLIRIPSLVLQGAGLAVPTEGAGQPQLSLFVIYLYSHCLFSAGYLV